VSGAKRCVGWGLVQRIPMSAVIALRSTPTPASAVARPTLPMLRGRGMKTRSAIGLFVIAMTSH
jgi:hypothetical protein